MQEATFLILTALAARSQHGYGIITDVREISGGRVRLRAGNGQRPRRRGCKPWARAAVAAMFALTSLSLLSSLAQGAATYVPVDLIAGGVLWLVEPAAVLLILSKESGPYYRQQQT